MPHPTRSNQMRSGKSIARWCRPCAACKSSPHSGLVAGQIPPARLPRTLRLPYTDVNQLGQTPVFFYETCDSGKKKSSVYSACCQDYQDRRGTPNPEQIVDRFDMVNVGLAEPDIASMISGDLGSTAVEHIHTHATRIGAPISHPDGPVLYFLQKSWSASSVLAQVDQPLEAYGGLRRWRAYATGAQETVAALA